MLRNGVIPIPPARDMAGFATFLCRVKEPAAGHIFTLAANGNLFSERLKAVLRIRVVNTNSSAKGGLAMENVRVFPSASVSSGSVSVTSADWPALKLNPGGFSK
jgi:hypothetical protein